MPVISPATVSQISYAPGSATDTARFKAVHKASAGLLVSSSVKSLNVAGRDVGSVAVYGTKPGLAKSTMFQDQYVVQLINAVAGVKSSPAFVRAHGQVIALSTGKVAVAGWFDGSKVVLLYRAGTTPDLAALAVSVRATPAAG
jgi:hypothetical protein